MCVPKVNVRRSPKTPRTPDRRHLSDLSKPRLSRRVVKGIKVNLNECWSKFQELHDMDIPLVEFRSASVIPAVDHAIMVQLQSLGK